MSAADFSNQMNWLDRHGYVGVTLGQVQRAWYHDGKLPPKPIVISFDDGYWSQFQFALQTIRTRGWVGVLDLVAGKIELSPGDVEAFVANGWEVVAHTVTHPDLTELGAAQLREEVEGSRRILQGRYEVRIDNFCYPPGGYDDAVLAAVKAAGYVGAMTTTTPGYASPAKPFALSRFEILETTGVAGLAADLRSG